MPTVSEVLVSIKGDAHELNESLEGAKEHLEVFGEVAASILEGFGMALGQMSFEMVAHSTHHLLEEFIEVNSAAEVWTAQMTLLEGSTAKASERIEQLAAWSHKAPFELTDIREANRLLQVFGGDALAGSKGMNLIGDAASFAQKPISEIAELVGRLHQALEAGSDDPRAIMTLRKMGVLSGDAAADLTKLVKTHADGAKIWDAFTAALGRTKGQMEVMMATFKGQMTNLADVTHEVLHEVGKPFFDGAKDGLLKVLGWLNGPEGEKVKEQLVELGKQFGAWAKVGGPDFFKRASEGVVRFMDYVSGEHGQKTIHMVAEITGALLKLATAAFIFGKLTAIIEPLIALGTTIFGFIKTLAILGPTIETITVMFPALGAAIELLTGPVGWVIGAITALWFAWRNNWGHIHEFTANVLAKIIHWYNQHATQFEKVGSWLNDVWNLILATVQSVWHAIVETVSAAWEVLSPLISGLVDFILGIFGMLSDLLTGNWSKLWEDLKATVGNAVMAILHSLMELGKQTLHIVSVIMGWLGHIPGVIGDAANTSAKFLDGLVDNAEAASKDMQRADDSQATNSEKNLANQLLGLSKLKAAHEEMHKKVAEGLPEGGLGLKTPKGTEKDKKGGKQTDPNDEVKSKIEELTKALYLNGDSSKYADLRYDLFKGTLKGATPLLKEQALALQRHADTMELTHKANEGLTEKADEYRKVLALGINPTKVATLAYEMMHSELKNGAKAARDHVLALASQAERMEFLRGVWSKYHEALDGVTLKMRSLINADDALGLSLMGTAKDWDTLDAAQKRALVTVAKGPGILESLHTQVDALKSKILELKGAKAEDILFGNVTAAAEKWLQAAPRATREQRSFAMSVGATIHTLKGQSEEIAKLTETNRVAKLAEAFAKGVGAIQSNIDKLKRGESETTADRWVMFWDKQRTAIDEFLKQKPKLDEFYKFIAALKGAGGKEMVAEDDSKYLKNFTSSMKEIEKEQERVNGAFREWVSQSHTAAVAAKEFENGIRQMTHAQAEQIVKAQGDLDARARQVEQIKAMGAKVADYIGGLVDNIVNGKIKTLFQDALAGFKQMLQQMAAEYMKAQITKGLMNLAAGMGSGGGGGSTSSGGTAAGTLPGDFFKHSAQSSNSGAARAVAASTRATSYGTPAMASGGAVSVTMHIHTPDVGGFRKSQRQIMSDGLKRANHAARKAGG